MKEYKFRCTGMQYHLDALNAIAKKNLYYTFADVALEAMYPEGKRIYENSYNVNYLAFEPEPTNPHDSNAIKVMADGHHIAYIKRGSCSQVKNLLASPDLLNVTIEIGGGKYKDVLNLGTDANGQRFMEVDEDESPIYAHVTFYVQEKKKFCTNCGKAVELSSKFCIYCGAKL